MSKGSTNASSSTGSSSNLKRHSIAAHGSDGTIFQGRRDDESSRPKAVIHPPAIAVSEQNTQKPEIDHEKALLAKRLANMKKRASMNPVMFYSKRMNEPLTALAQSQHPPPIFEATQEGPSQRRERSLSVNTLNFCRKNPPVPGATDHPDSEGPTTALPVGSPPLKRNYKTLLGRCYFCGSGHHLVEQCGRGEPVECEICGQLGHLTEFCEEYLSSDNEYGDQ